MDVKVYIKRTDLVGYLPLDLFKDEKIEINLLVKNLSDISKIRADFTQPFSVPANHTNNPIFEYWYDSDVDGTFNANIRVDAYIEVNSLPYRYGSIQLDNCKMKNGMPDSYNLTFFGAGVNLSDKFGEDKLSDLPLSAFDHVYSTAVANAIHDDSIHSGNIYYPLINAMTFMDVGNSAVTDLQYNANTISYLDFKPAIRSLRIIEAMETKYGFVFSRDFFDRSVFYNLFLWLHRESGRMKTSSTALDVDYTAINTVSVGWSVSPSEFNLTNNTVRLLWSDFPTVQANRRFNLHLLVNTTDTVFYKVEVFDNGVLHTTFDNLYGMVDLTIYAKRYVDDNTNHLFSFKISSLQGNFTFNTQLQLQASFITSGPVVRAVEATSPSQTTTNAIVKINEQIPDMKVKDFINSLIAEFNLIITPLGIDNYYIDTLDSWYAKGKLYDITTLVDNKEVTVKRPDVKKRIDFMHQKTETVLGKRYFDTFQQGYGDLKAQFNISGSDLKIETQFENLMFERMVNETTLAQTELHAGYATTIDNKPAKGKPMMFYRNGIDTASTIYIQPSYSNTTTWHTATEDNKVFAQVTNSLNFGADNSTYFYAPINQSLYANFYQTYISELYDRKTRVKTYKCYLPIRILLNLGLNDRFQISDKKYKISSAKVDLTNGWSELELFSDLGAPFDSASTVTPLTVDNTNITVDNDIITVDAVSTYFPTTTYTVDEISITAYSATKGEEHFELKISTGLTWSLAIGAGWVTANKTSGTKTTFVRVSVAKNTGSARSTTLVVTINAVNYTLTINQA